MRGLRTQCCKAAPPLLRLECSELLGVLGSSKAGPGHRDREGTPSVQKPLADTWA